MNKIRDKRWFTVEECAEYLGLTKRAVYNMVHRREIPFSKLGERVRFDRQSLDEGLAQNTVGLRNTEQFKK